MDINYGLKQVAKELGIPELYPDFYMVKKEQVEIQRIWYANILFNRKKFLIAVVRSDKWQYGFLLVPQSNEIKEFQLVRCDLTDWHDSVADSLRSFDLFPEDSSRAYDTNLFIVEMQVRAWKSDCHLWTTGDINSQSHKNVLDNLLKTFHEIVLRSNTNTLQIFASKIPTSWQ